MSYAHCNIFIVFVQLCVCVSTVYGKNCEEAAQMDEWIPAYETVEKSSNKKCTTTTHETTAGNLNDCKKACTDHGANNRYLTYNSHTSPNTCTCSEQCRPGTQAN